jgi:uncharacterized membrane protein
MNDTTIPGAESYLSALETALADVAPVARATILEDVRVHIADALDRGQSIAPVLEGLGSPEAMAFSALSELSGGAPSALVTTATGANSARRTLLMAAIAVSALTAVDFGFALAEARQNGNMRVDFTRVLVMSFLTLVPVIVAVLPLVLPVRMRAGLTLTGAIAGSVLSAAALPLMGAPYLPVVMLLWAAVLIPWLHGRVGGRRGRIVTRVALSLAMVVPPALIGSDLVIHGFEFTWLVWPGAVLGVLLVGLAAADVRAGHMLAAVLGGGLMIFAMIERGPLFDLLWLPGSLYLTVGLCGLLIRQPTMGAQMAEGVTAAARP